MQYTASHKNDRFVKLSDQEIDSAAMHGKRMREVSLLKGHKNKQGYNPDDKKAMRIQMLGAVAEAAACKFLGLEIDLKSEVFGVPDVAKVVQVRLIGNDDYGLRVYPDDDNWVPIMGVIIPKGKEREPYRLPGWIFAEDGKKEQWSMNPGNRVPMYAVPQENLRSLDELEDLVKYAITSTDTPEEIIHKWRSKCSNAKSPQ